MNRRQKKVMQAQLLHEKEILDKLKGIYKEALDEVDAKIAELIGREAAEGENTLQGVIYQRQYQEAIRRQIGGILDKMNSEQFTAVSDYLTKCYEDGFYGALYDLHGQGIPLVFPIDQKMAVKAIQTDSKLSEGLYKRLGDDTKALKKTVAQSLTRGIAQGSNYAEIARYIAGTMVGYNPKKPGGAYARAMRIARTEGNRIANSAHMDSQRKAKEKGADIVKQWDATLDKRTRDSHAAVDGELREIDEPFSNGLMFPGDPHGEAAEVVNCRCSLLQRAKWALDEDELQTLKDRAEYFGLDKAESFEEFREKYTKAVDKDRRMAYNESTDREQYAGYKAVLGEDAPKSFESFQAVKYDSHKEYEALVGYYRYKCTVPEATKADYQVYKAIKATGIKGSIRVPPPQINTSELILDIKHIEKRGHGVSFDEALSYIKNARFALRRTVGRGSNCRFYINYFSDDGAAYVDVDRKLIRTAFKRTEFDLMATNAVEAAKNAK